MGTLYLVRHGQASFGATDYDRLSELGTRQCHALGRWLHERGTAFDGVLVGTLRRHVQSLAAIAEGYGGLPAATPWPGLNEYDPEALLRAVHPGLKPAADARDAEAYRSHFRLLREALLAWIDGRCEPAGMPPWPVFAADVGAALDHVRTQHDGDVLLVSSGGPIATAVAQVLGAPPQAMVELNLRIRNSALSEFAFTPRRHVLLSFNSLPHLEVAGRREWITYA